MTFTTIEAPRYRALEMTDAGGFAVEPGVEFSMKRWPLPYAHEPLNELAKRIAEYAKRSRLAPGFPSSPYSATARDFYLPGWLGYMAPCGNQQDLAETLSTPLADADVLPGMPAYTFTGARERRIGRRTVKPGETVVLLGWPEMDTLQPANDIAAEVLDYYQRHIKHDARLSSPWCWYRLAVVLPQLEGGNAAYVKSRLQGADLGDKPTSIAKAHPSRITTANPDRVRVTTFDAFHRSHKG